MRTFIFALLLGCAALALPGCSTHSIWIISDSVSTQGVTGHFAAHTNKVFLTDMSLPPSLKYESIGKIDAGKVTYSPTEGVLILMADESRKLGANAVINLKVWRQPAGWSWSAPHGSGEAIRVGDTNSLAGLTGYWY
jgi:hypothetical protein